MIVFEVVGVIAVVDVLFVCFPVISGFVVPGESIHDFALLLASRASTTSSSTVLPLSRLPTTVAASVPSVRSASTSASFSSSTSSSSSSVSALAGGCVSSAFDEGVGVGVSVVRDKIVFLWVRG